MNTYGYKNYTNARNAVWDLILGMESCSLPIDVFALARSLNIKVLPYKKSRIIRLIMRLGGAAGRHEGIAAEILGRKYIFYDDTIRSEGRIRFTIAHEIGHFHMSHLNAGSRFRVGFAQRGGSSDADEREANAFAVRLLAPACVLNRVNVGSPEDIMKLCGMSYEASKYRFERLQKLRERNYFYFDKREKEVEGKFEDFIKENTKM